MHGVSHRRTAERPCLWDNHCNKADYYNWLQHADQWMFAVLGRMRTPAELRSMSPLVKRLASLTRKDISFLEGWRLTGDTFKLRDMSLQLKEIAEQLGQPVQRGEVTDNLARPTIELPVPAEIQEALGFDWSFDKFLSDLTGGATDILRAKWFQENVGWLALAVLGFLVLSKGRKAS